MDSIVLKTLTGDKTGILTNEKDLTSDRPSTFTADFSNVNEVYSLFPGSVIYVGFYKNMGTVAVSVSNYEIVRYLNLKEIFVLRGEEIKKGKLLGSLTDKYRLQFEYGTQWQGKSNMPIRIQNRTFFKQNPIDILNGKYAPYLEQEVQYGRILSDETIELTEDQKQEFGIVDSYNLDLPPIDPSINVVTSLKDVSPETLAMLSDNSGRWGNL